jgi:hypothetical protein
LNEETRDNAWAKRPEQNGTETGVERKYSGAVAGQGKAALPGGEEERGRMGENNRGIKLETATE